MSLSSSSGPVERYSKAEWREAVDLLSRPEGAQLPPQYSLTQPYAEALAYQRLGKGWLNKLAMLKNMPTLMLLDDSGSMNNLLSDERINAYRATTMTRLDGKPIQTQYDELWVMVLSLLPFLIFLEMKVEIAWLNRDESVYINGNTNLRQATLALNSIFAMGAHGVTPIVARMIALEHKLATNHEEHFLMVFTDGEPSDGTVKDLIQLYTQRQGSQTMYAKPRTSRQKKNHLTLVMCTDNDKAVAYMDGLDKALHNTDVVDDWFTETLQIMEVHWRLKLSFDVRERYNWGNHLAKALLGSHDQEIDLMDEKTKKFGSVFRRFKEPSFEELIKDLPSSTLYHQDQLRLFANNMGHR